MTKENPSRQFLQFFFTLYLSLLTFLVLLSIQVAKGHDVLWVNSHYSFFLDRFFSTITYLGDGVIFVPIIIYSLFVRFHNTLSWSCIALVNGILISLSKHAAFAHANRPVKYLDHNLLHFVEGVQVHIKHAFPSGHTATIFAVATFICLKYSNKYLTILVTFVALLVGYSRIYLLQHFLIDVTAGAIIGSLSSMLVWLFLGRQYNLPAWTSGRLEVTVKRSNNNGVFPSGN